jgi:DNA-binding beta-propeller fold protein YncE
MTKECPNANDPCPAATLPPLVIRHWSFLGAWSLVIGHLLAGCSPKSGSFNATLTSECFSRAEVFGTRGTAPGQFSKPRSVAVDTVGNFFVVDMTGRVQKFSPDGLFRNYWQMPQTDLGKPKGMGRDLAGNVIVVEPHYQRVNHFSSDGRLAAQWNVHATNLGPSILPRAVAVNSRGEIFVSEYGLAERVLGFTADGRKQWLEFGRAGRGPGEFSRAEGLAVGPDDRIFVADSCNHRIQIFSRDGRWLASYGRPGNGVGELSYPYDIRVDAGGRQYVCEFGNSRIQVFDAQNRPLEIIGGPGTAPGQFNNPWSIALDAAGNLYVADAGNHRVQKLFAVRGSSFVAAFKAEPDTRSSRTTNNEQRTTNQ